MASAFTTPTITQSSKLGVSRFDETAPIELLSGSSEQEIETLIRAVYRQVLGNAYVMKSERLRAPESQLRQSELSVREFVRQVAKSDLYRSRFFDNCFRYRAIELNFKHLLGRAPESYEEMRYHSTILDQYGFYGEIDSYLDSYEYQKEFGESVVPYYRGYKTEAGKNTVGFTYMFKLLRGASSSDKNNTLGNYSHLNRQIIANTPSAVIPISTVDSYGGLTDVNKLLAEVLKPKSPTKSSERSYQEYIAQTEDYKSLKNQCQEQAKLIESLERQLADLRPFGTIGEAELNRWLSFSPGSSSTTSSTTSEVSSGKIPIQNSSPESFPSLQRLCEEQEKAIANLQQKIADLRPLAAIGQARLNKWRNRNFSSR